MAKNIIPITLNDEQIFQLFFGFQKPNYDEGCAHYLDETQEKAINLLMPDAQRFADFCGGQVDARTLAENYLKKEYEHRGIKWE